MFMFVTYPDSNESVKALIIAGVGKYFSCGLDLDWMSQQDDATLGAFFPRYQDFIMRLLVFPMPTVAAINGQSTEINFRHTPCWETRGKGDNAPSPVVSHCKT